LPILEGLGVMQPGFYEGEFFILVDNYGSTGILYPKFQNSKGVKVQDSLEFWEAMNKVAKTKVGSHGIHYFKGHYRVYDTDTPSKVVGTCFKISKHQLLLDVERWKNKHK